MKPGDKARRIEMAVLWDDDTWSKEFVDVPVSTPDDQLESVGRAVLLTIYGQHDKNSYNMVGSLLYSHVDDEIFY